MTHSITPDGLEEILHNFALTLLRTRQTIVPVGSITFAEAKAAINQYMLDTFMELIGEDEELQLPNPTFNNYDAVQRSVGRNQARAELRKAAQEKLKP